MLIIKPTKIVIKILLSSLLITGISYAVPVNNIDNIKTALPIIKLLKATFAEIIIYDVVNKHNFIELDTSIGNIYINNQSVLLSSKQVLLVNYKNLSLNNNRNIEKVVEESTRSKITASNIDHGFRYFKNDHNNTIITNIDIVKHPYAIMGAFLTKQDLIKIKLKLKPLPVTSIEKSKITKKQMPLIKTAKASGIVKAIHFIEKTYPQNIVKFKSTYGNKGTLTIFTDYTCPHCDDLHKHIGDLLKRGFNIQYLMIPRNGLDTQVAANMEKALCSVNPINAVEHLYVQKTLPSSLKEQKNCKANIDTNLSLAQAFNVTGTPTIIGSNGKITSGFTTVYTTLQSLEFI